MKLLLWSFTLFSFISCTSNGTPKSPDTMAAKSEAPAAASNLWVGEWGRQEWQNSASLEVTGISGDSIFFSLQANSGAHISEIEGGAAVKGNTATYLYTGEQDSCLIEFKLSGDSVITVKQQGNCMAALAVSYAGVYKNNKLISSIEKEETLIDLGIFKTKKEDSLFRSLVGNDYTLFVHSTQITSEGEDLDGLNATMQASGVRGLFSIMENIIMKDASQNIWAAVLHDNKVYYYTNSDLFKTSLPKTIENWRQNFKDYEVVFK